MILSLSLRPISRGCSMADPALVPAPVFGPAHKVVIDAVSFAAANVMAEDDRWPLVIEALAEALPVAVTLGQPPIDGMTQAGAVLVAAWAMRQRKAPDWAEQWCRADLAVQAAATNFAWARLAQSTDAFRSTFQQDLPR